MPCRVCLLNVIHCRADPNTFPQPRHSLSTFPHYTVALHLPTFTWYTVSEQLWSVKVEKSPFRWQSALTSRKERSPSTAPVLSELAQSEGEVITLSSRFFSECYLNKFRPSSTLSFIFRTLHWQSGCYRWVQSSQLLFTKSYDESFFFFSAIVDVLGWIFVSTWLQKCSNNTSNWTPYVHFWHVHRSFQGTQNNCYLPQVQYPPRHITSWNSAP